MKERKQGALSERQLFQRDRKFIKDLDRFDLPLSSEFVLDLHLPKSQESYLITLSEASRLVELVKEHSEEIYTGTFSTDEIFIRTFDRDKGTPTQGQEVALARYLKTPDPKRSIKHLLQVVGSALDLPAENIVELQKEASRSYRDRSGILTLNDNWQLKFSTEDWWDFKTISAVLESIDKQEYVERWVRNQIELLQQKLTPEKLNKLLVESSLEDFTSRTAHVVTLNSREFDTKPEDFGNIISNLGWVEITDEEEVEALNEYRIQKKLYRHPDNDPMIPVLGLHYDEYINGTSEVHLASLKTPEVDAQIRREFEPKFKQAVLDEVKRRMNDPEKETIDLNVQSIVYGTLKNMGQEIPSYQLHTEMYNLSRITFHELLNIMTEYDGLKDLAENYRQLWELSDDINNGSSEKMELASGFRPSAVCIKISKADL